MGRVGKEDGKRNAREVKSKRLSRRAREKEKGIKKEICNNFLTFHLAFIQKVVAAAEHEL